MKEKPGKQMKQSCEIGEQEDDQVNNAPAQNEPHNEEDMKEYRRFFRDHNHKFTAEQVKSLNKLNINFSCQQYQHDLHISKLDESINGHVMKLSIGFSHFMFELLVLNLVENSEMEIGNKLIGFGNFGLVYLIRGVDGKVSAVKRVKYAKSNGTSPDPSPLIIQNTLKNAIFEYCLYKLMSGLEIGPKITPCFGFDLITYNDYVEFTMEACEPCSSFGGDLYDSLKVMHCLKIIHGDIKPDNIMWSPSFSKNVFVDFGLSRFVHENTEKSTLTYFFGTYNYCSPSMKSTLTNRDRSLVNLYFNDLHCLKKSQEILDCQSHRFNLGKIQLKIVEAKNACINFIIASLMYLRKFDQIKLLIQKNKEMVLMNINYQIIIQCQDIEFYGKTVNLLWQENIISKQQNEKLRNRLNQDRFYQKDKEMRLRLSQRFGQTLTKYEGSSNQIMKYILYLHGQDASPRAIYEKQELIQRIFQYNPEVHDYWRNVVRLTLNLYVSHQELVYVFCFLLKKLKVDYSNHVNNLQLFIHLSANRLAMEVIQRYRFNMFRQRELQKKLQQSHPRTFWKYCANYLPQDEGLEEFIQLNLQKTANKNNDEPLFDQQIMREGQLMQMPEQKVVKLILLFFQQYRIRYQQDSSSYFSDLKSFINKISDFKPAARTEFITQLREKLLLQKQLQCAQDDFFRQQKNFYREACCYCLCVDKSLRVLILDRLIHLFEKKEQNQTKITMAIREIFNFVIQVGGSETKLIALMGELKLLVTSIFKYPKYLHVIDEIVEKSLSYVETILSTVQITKYQGIAEGLISLLNHLSSLEIKDYRERLANLTNKLQQKFQNLGESITYINLKARLVDLESPEELRRGCQILKRGLDMSSQSDSLKKFISNQLTSSYITYILFAAMAGQPAEQQLSELIYAMFSSVSRCNKILISLETVGAVACYFGRLGMSRHQEFLELVYMLAKFLSQQEPKLFLHYHLCLRDIVRVYFQNLPNLENMELIMESFSVWIEQLIDTFESSRIYTFSIMQIYIILYIRMHEQFICQKLLNKILRVLHTSSQENRNIIKSIFCASMNCWLARSSSRSWQQLSLRKQKICRIRNLRCPFFKYQNQNCSIRTLKYLFGSGRAKNWIIRARIELKLNDLRDNKSQSVNLSSKSSVRNDQWHYFLLILNRKIPEQLLSGEIVYDVSLGRKN